MKEGGFKRDINENGFTLIELLVVVLIIGILAAVALPQYQKAGEKSRATQALTLLKSVYQVATLYYMENGTYPNSFADMDVDIPWNGNKKWANLPGVLTKSNEDWSLQLYPVQLGGFSIYLGRISGKYAGAGFVVTLVASDGLLNAWKIECAERISSGITFSTDLKAGDYCTKIMGGTQIDAPFFNTARLYELP